MSVDIDSASNDAKLTRFFHVWKCEVLHEHHRPNGKAQVSGCGRWQVKASKLDRDEKHLQAQCLEGCKGNGGKGQRKVRLNPKTRQFFTYLSRVEAYHQAITLNRRNV